MLLELLFMMWECDSAHNLMPERRVRQIISYRCPGPTFTVSISKRALSGMTSPLRATTIVSSRSAQVLCVFGVDNQCPVQTNLCWRSG